MTHRRLIILLLLFLLPLGPSCAQTVGTLGVNFWTTFFKNDHSNLSVQVSQGVSISALRACSATVAIPGTSWAQTINLSPNTVTQVQVPADICYLNNSSSTPQHLAVHITSTDTISVASYSYTNQSLDLAGILPVQSLGSDYIVLTATPQSPPSSLINPPADYYAPAFFCIIGVENNTVVHIHPSVPVRLANDDSTSAPFQVVLNMGDAVFLESYFNAGPNADLSGTHIFSDYCKKFAVVNGNQKAIIPSSCTTGDVVFEQAYPTTTWGREFLVTRSLSRCADQIKVIAAADHDTVFVNGQLTAILSAGQTFAFSLLQNHTYIRATEPSGVALFMRSFADCPGSNDSDPSMAWIPPIEQGVRSTIFSCLYPSTSLPTLSSHAVNIVVRSEDTAAVYLDNQRLSHFTHLNSGISYKRQSLNLGSHRLQAGGHGLIAHAYGMSPQISYSYLVGAQFANLSHIILAPTHACNHQQVPFSIHLTEGETVSWAFDDGFTTTDSSFTHAFHQPGSYNVSATVYGAGTCASHLTFSHTISIASSDTIHQHHQVLCGHSFIAGSDTLRIFSDTIIHTFRPTQYGCFDTLIHHFHVSDAILHDTAHACQGSDYLWHGQHLLEPGDYTHRRTIGQCSIDSNLHLIHHPNYDINIDTTICAGSSVLFGGLYYSFGDHETRYHSIHICDSIIRIHISTFNTSSTDIYDTIQSTAYYYADTLISHPGHYIFHHPDQNGCDSIVHLYLTSCPCLLWVPNVFTPSMPTNNMFHINCSEMAEAEVLVYDRNGDLVTRFDGLTDGWDGTHLGTPCQQGTYVYHIIYRCWADHNYQHFKTGTFTLIR